FFVAVVGFDDFYVVVVTQGSRGGAQQVEDNVDAHNHVGSEDYWGRFGRQRKLLFFRVSHTGGANNQHFAMGAAELCVFQSEVRKGEVHQHVEVVFHFVQAAGHFYTGLADTSHFAGVGTDQAAARLNDGGTELKTFSAVYRLD